MKAKPPQTDYSIPTGDPTRRMTVTYIVSLSIIAFLSILVHFMLDKIIEEQSHSATIINISGQQRMLSQRVSLFTMEYLSSGNADSKQDAKSALEVMINNHRFLLSGHNRAVQQSKESPLSPVMNDLYFSLDRGVDQEISRFIKLVNQALEQEQSRPNSNRLSTDFEFWQLARDALLNNLNEIVKQYETESLQKIEDLRYAQKIVLLIIILTILIEAVFIFRPMVRKVTSFADRLQKEANHDHLTGLLNRRSFAILIEKTWALSKRHGHPLCLISFDIDHFKSVNDDYGHDVGDKAIQHISNVIRQSTRMSDSVARFGGEEFMVMLPHTSKQDASKLADKIREKIEQSPLHLKQLILEITVSGGVSECENTDGNIEEALKRSDDALYQAKNAGRNKICVS